VSEALIHRVLGAVRFVDGATRVPVRSRLRLEADRPVTWRRNAGGAYVVWRADGLDAHTGHDEGRDDAGFEAIFQAPPGAPAPGSEAYVVSVEDPSGEFLGRQFELRLPRSPGAAPGATPELFTPLEVALYRSPAAGRAGAGAALLAFVHDGRGQAGRLPGALVTASVDGQEVGRAITGPTGEALVEAVMLPSFAPAPGDGAVMTSEIEASVRAAVLPGLLADEGGAWRLVAPPDPDSAAFEGGEARSATGAAGLRSGRLVALSIAVDMA
jgi:hypothetical protein